MFMKDLDANDLPQIATAIYDQLVHTHTLSDDEAEAVRKMLLLKHSHVGHKQHNERPSSPGGLNLQDMGDRNFTTPSMLNTVTAEDPKLPKVRPQLSLSPPFSLCHPSSASPSTRLCIFPSISATWIGNSFLSIQAKPVCLYPCEFVAPTSKLLWWPCVGYVSA